MITQDGIIFGLLAFSVACVVALGDSKHPWARRFFSIVPSVLLAYLVPALLTTFGVIDLTNSHLYAFTVDHLLPACLILMTLSLDLKALVRLGPRCILIFLSGTLGVIIGGPIALALAKLIAPASLHPDSWKVLTTLAGSWIGGGVNQASMKAALNVPEDLFLTSVGVDILVGSFYWMGLMLFLANKNERVNRWLKADSALIDRLELKELAHVEKPSRGQDFFWMVGIAFGGVALCRSLAGPLVAFIGTHAPELATYNLTSEFFWVVIFASMVGVLISLTPLRSLEERGASKLAGVLLYLLIAVIGAKINLFNLWTSPIYFLIGFVWINIHGLVILLATRLLKAPLFFLAVGSQANIGAAASAPVVAAAFSPRLAPVGVLLAILGYVLGNYGAYLCGLLMRMVHS